MSWIPVVRIFGALSFIMPAMLVTMVGTVAMMAGKLSTNDFPSASISCNPASTMSPTFSRRLPENSRSVSNPASIICGAFAVTPSVSWPRMETADAATCGRADITPWTSELTIEIPEDRRDGAAATNASMICMAIWPADSRSWSKFEAKPSRNEAKSSIAALHISPVSVMIAEIRDTIKSVPACATCDLFARSEEMNDWHTCRAVLMSPGAACAMLVRACAKTEPVAFIIPSSPPSLKASWSCWARSRAVATASFIGVSSES